MANDQDRHRTVTLREEDDGEDSRLLTASITPDGDDRGTAPTAPERAPFA